MRGLHQRWDTWRRTVDAYFTLTEFARRKFIEAGLPADRIAVKPNFLAADPGVAEGGGGYAIFVGRLSAEKGLATLLAAWERLAGRMTLKIVGDGPLRAEVQAAALRTPGIEWLGYRPSGEVLDLIGGAAVLVMPSIWYETFGRTIIEAFAKGTPVIASRLGAMAELVDAGRTGLLFEPGSAADLAACVDRLLADPEQCERLRLEARREYEARYTAAANYRQLMAVYQAAAARRGRSLPDIDACEIASGAMAEAPP